MEKVELGIDGLIQYSLDQAMEMIFLFDETGRIVYGNEEARHLLEYEDVRGVMVTEVFPGEFWTTDTGFASQCHFNREVVSLMAYRKNHTCFAVEARMLRYGEGPHMYICMATDASKQNFLEKRATQANQEIEEAHKVKSQFVSNVTHELRTPVNGILGTTKELMEVETDPEKLRLLKVVERGCNDMKSIINNILDFSKLDAGKVTLENKEFHFRNMIDYVKSNHVNRITEKGLDFFITVSPEVPEYIIGDELRIVQILNNLLSNACKFTSAGKIMLEVLKTNQIDNRVELFFMVIDTGIGIDKANQDKLFKSFSQVDASATRKYGGTGLGLNISKQLVELMDGNIRMESETGKGTTFSFYIWVELARHEMEKMSTNHTPESKIAMDSVIPSSQDMEEEQKIWQFGEKENIEEIKRKMSKLILCVEMENWEKAEMFMDTLRQLTQGAPREIKSLVLRLKMVVQKEDHDMTVEAFEKLQAAFAEWR